MKLRKCIPFIYGAPAATQAGGEDAWELFPGYCFAHIACGSRGSGGDWQPLRVPVPSFAAMALQCQNQLPVPGFLLTAPLSLISTPINYGDKS